MILAMQASGSTDSNTFKDKIHDVANAPGEKINPVNWAKLLKFLLLVATSIMSVPQMWN